MRIAVTGAGGFIGTALVRQLLESGESVFGFVKRAPEDRARHPHMKWIVSDLERTPPSASRLVGSSVLVHLAGRAHVTCKSDSESRAAFWRSNVWVTKNLATQARDVGVKRFVFVSSIGVYGRSLVSGLDAIESTALDPVDPYAVSKRDAEIAVNETLCGSEVEVVIIRPALVVGSAAPGNLARLAKLIQMGVPLPIPSGGNARSYVSLLNLIDLIVLCIKCPRASGQIFNAVEQEQPSTEQVMRWISDGMERRIRTIEVPSGLLRVVAKVINKTELFEKLYGDLRVDGTKARRSLGWTSVQPLQEAFRDLGRGTRSAISSRRI